VAVAAAAAAAATAGTTTIIAAEVGSSDVIAAISDEAIDMISILNGYNHGEMSDTGLSLTANRADRRTYHQQTGRLGWSYDIPWRRKNQYVTADRKTYYHRPKLAVWRTIRITQ
jgi:hypothetical protein